VKAHLAIHQSVYENERCRWQTKTEGITQHERRDPDNARPEEGPNIPVVAGRMQERARLPLRE